MQFKECTKIVQCINKCTVKTSNAKLGHTHNCYIDLTLCKVMSLSIQVLSPHFPNVRNIKRLVYRLTSVYRKMCSVDRALLCTDLQTLKDIVTLAQKKADMYKYQYCNVVLSDDDIISKYYDAFAAFTKRSMDTSRHICVSCERFCYKRSVCEINKLKIPIDNAVWRDLMAYAKQQNINLQYICHYCLRKMREV